MKNLKILSVVLLAVLCIPFLSINPTPASQSHFVIETGMSKSANPVIPSPEPPHRILPIRLLVYTEFVDASPGGEFENVMTSINITYGTDYYWTNLSSYTNLASELPNHDVLIIPEQEAAYKANMTVVGQAWDPILSNWVQAGGIVILMAYWEMEIGEQGITAHIYNETGLITYSSAIPVTLSPIFLVNTSDALARGVSGSWAAPDGTVAFATSEGTVVVDDGAFPVVIHKVLGTGHVILLGADFYLTEPNMQALLANSIRLHRHIIFDNSHSQYENIFGAYSTFADDLVAQNFAVSTCNNFDPIYIAASDVFIVPYCATSFTASEKTYLEDYVMQGGGTFLLGDWGSWGNEINELTNLFGYNLDTSGTRLIDTNDNEPPINDVSQPFYSGSNIHNHSLTLGVSTVQMFYGTGITTMPTHAFSAITADLDGTAYWLNATPADGVTCYAASTHGLGRIVVSGDCNFIEDDSDYDSDGTFDYFEHDHDTLLVNTIRWLSAAGIKERTVLFDDSHSPYWSFSNYVDFTDYLTSNGYTVHWMSTFYSNLVTAADILVISGASVPYSPAENVTIRNFVSNGGGLVLLADWTFFGDNLLPVANEFGMSHNNTHAYLSDSDDGSGGGNSAITYEGSNIGVHPITTGVHEIYVDRGTGLINLGGGTALVITDNDGTSQWYDDSSLYWPAPSVPVFAANTFGLGRIVYLTDINFFDNAVFDREDNNLFLVNAFQWLAVNRAPTVTITSPNGGEVIEGAINSITWTAQDPNKDSMTYDILYSINGGASWTPIATGHTTTSINWDASSVPESMDALIRVVAHDYELSGQDDSDAIFTVESEGPQISNIQTTPAIPLASIPVIVSADIIDASGVASAVCQVSINSGSTWTDFTMTVSSGSTYEADIGAYTAGTTVDYRIVATDSSTASRIRTSPISSFYIPALPPVIPGFPIEAIILALAAGLGFILLVRRRRHTVSS
ncbi:MAG: Loki-CTERM sorting domain-containing protein [Promethearchaeota archaeon]